jgi:hypothetical protein
MTIKLNDRREGEQLLNYVFDTRNFGVVIVTSWHPRTALEPAKPLTHSFALQSCGLKRQGQCVWSSDPE